MLFKHKLSFNLNLIIINKGKYNTMSEPYYIIALSTFPSKEKAEEAAKAIVEEDLAACVNLIDRIGSIYKWKGKIVSETEILLIIKTLSSKQQQLKKFIKSNHTYANPELIFLPITDGLENYLNWIKEEVG